MVWEVARHWTMLEAEFPAWEFWTLYEPLEFLRTWYRPDPESVFLVLALAACGLLLGIATRFSAAVFFLAYVYQFLLDPTHWNNHYYLISLLAFWLIFARSEAIWSLDSLLRHSSRRDFVPRWQIGIFQVQLAIVYVYGGLAKLNVDWLAAEPVYPWIKLEEHNLPLFGPLLAEKSTAYFVAYFGLIFDLTIPFLLLWRRTRPFAIVLAVLFHLTNTKLFDIGVFPYLGIASLIVFLEPDTPRKFVRRLSDAARRFFELPERLESEQPTEPKPVEIPRSGRVTVILLGVYLVLQLVLPLRHWLYKGNVEWTEEGKHFSWRMMLSHKNTLVRLYVADPDTGVILEVDQGGRIARTLGIGGDRRSLFIREIQPGVRKAMIVPEKRLSGRHRAGKGVWGNPRLLAQYARYLASEARELGIRKPLVYADAVASLNGRPFQYLVDPDVDLARAERPAWSTPTWVVQLKPNQPIGDYPPNNRELYKRVTEVIRAHHQRQTTSPIAR